MIKLRKPNLGAVGHSVLFLVVGGLLAFNATLLYGMQSKVKGEVQAAEAAAKPAELQLTILSVPDCPECFDPIAFVGPLKTNDRVRITSEKTVEYTSDEGTSLVQKYGVTRVPTVLVAGDVDKVFDAASFSQNLGTKAEDGTLVVTNVPAPYVEVASGAVKGKFTLTYLTDKSCTECYDPNLHQRALANLTMRPSQERSFDRSDAEGKRIILQYKIESTPTILLSGELDVYPQFQQIWPTVGSVETDGTYIFRAGQPLMGAYREVKTGKVVKPEPLPEQAQ